MVPVVRWLVCESRCWNFEWMQLSLPPVRVPLPLDVCKTINIHIATLWLGYHIAIKKGTCLSLRIVQLHQHQVFLASFPLRRLSERSLPHSALWDVRKLVCLWPLAPQPLCQSPPVCHQTLPLFFRQLLRSQLLHCHLMPKSNPRGFSDRNSEWRMMEVRT